MFKWNERQFWVFRLRIRASNCVSCAHFIQAQLYDTVHDHVPCVPCVLCGYLLAYFDVFLPLHAHQSFHRPFWARL
jgi:Zn ribbon nucleic-acid-binding protein